MDADDAAPLLRDQTIDINGLERAYHLKLPESPENNPLVIILHGHTGSHDQTIGDESGKSPMKLWLNLAEEEDFVVAVPNGTLGPEDTRGWNDCRSDSDRNPDSDDVLFLSQLIDELTTEYNLNSQRVYVAGLSNGAAMAMRLAQEIPTKLAAIACIVNNLPLNSKCTDSTTPISVLYMNGTADPLIPYEGGQVASNGGQVQSTDRSIAYWIERNGTDQTAVVEELADVDKDDGSSISKFTYPNGSDNTEVVLYRVMGGGHTSPSLVERYSSLYKVVVGSQNGDIEMSSAVWDFFESKSR